jgi:hypothetical protein
MGTYINNADIEACAHELQVSIWKQRGTLCPMGIVDPVDMLDPEFAACVLGVSYEVHDSLGNRFNGNGVRVEIAGLIDRQAGKIAVSSRFHPDVVRFTGAHEIGHWLLHGDKVMHKDLPVKGLTVGRYVRPQLEREADHFAAFLLMPRKLVTARLEMYFSTRSPIVFDEGTAFALRPDDPESLLSPDDGSFERALAIASCESYRGKHFHSLAKQFHVSVPTMAIQLSECGLIQA